jgi:capsular exopolysaccharide synthesis family protein
MSRLQRAVEKAEREGRLSWTRPVEAHQQHATAVEEPPAAPPARPQAPPPSHHVDPPADRVAWPEPLPSFDDTVVSDDAVDDGVSLSPLFVAATEPGSPAAEQYRLLRTRLETRDASGRTQLLLVTSPRLGDGKTTTSSNLALTLARDFQHRVILVEADLRRPTLAQRFGVSARRGLIDVLLGGLPLDEAIIPIPGHHLSLLPAGEEGTRSTELLASSMMQRAIEDLRSRFDRIIVDTPPVALADTHILARIADGVIVVVRAGVTPRPALERALAAIDRERLLGLVLNEVDDSASDYYPNQDYLPQPRT